MLHLIALDFIFHFSILIDGPLSVLFIIFIQRLKCFKVPTPISAICVFGVFSTGSKDHFYGIPLDIAYAHYRNMQIIGEIFYAFYNELFFHNVHQWGKNSGLEGHLDARLLKKLSFWATKCVFYRWIENWKLHTAMRTCLKKCLWFWYQRVQI